MRIGPGPSVGQPTIRKRPGKNGAPARGKGAAQMPRAREMARNKRAENYLHAADLAFRLPFRKIAIPNALRACHFSGSRRRRDAVPTNDLCPPVRLPAHGTEARARQPAGAHLYTLDALQRRSAHALDALQSPSSHTLDALRKRTLHPFDTPAKRYTPARLTTRRRTLRPSDSLRMA